MELHERLKSAVEKHPEYSIRGFQKAMEQKDVTGTAYATVHSYLKGDTEPSVGFLRTAAELLGVREEWLILGKGEPSAVEEALRAQAFEDVVEQEGEEVPVRIEMCWSLANLPVAARQFFTQVVARYYEAAEDAERELVSEEAQTLVGELARDLDFLLRLPLDGQSWSLRSSSELSPRELETYALTMLQALLVLIPNAEAGDPLADYDGSALSEWRKRYDDIDVQMVEDGKS